ncbi:MAG: FecR family protein [Myxococcales bacterium]|nr:FecR family protein [Myxococcales bacterium]
MAELQRPLGNALREASDEASRQRIWRRIEDARVRRRGRRSAALPWLATGVLAAALSAAVLVPSARSPSGSESESMGAEAPGRPVPPTPAAAATASPKDAPPAPLTLADGRPIGTLRGPTAASDTAAPPPRRELLSDGSALLLEAGAQLEALESSGHQFVSALRAGRVVFDVRPGGPRRWSIETPLLRVEVVGTRFVVERSERAVRVAVERGAVLVRSPSFQDGVRRLEAGDAVEVRAPEAVPANPAAAAPGSWRRAAAAGAYDRAYGSLGPDGIGALTLRSESVQELLILADVARLSGHPAEAVPPLMRIVQRHRSSTQAALAAMTLGRLQLDQLAQPAVAASSFELALELGLPRSLRRACHLRLVEAHRKAGEPEAAARAERRARASFPDFAPAAASALP